MRVYELDAEVELYQRLRAATTDDHDAIRELIGPPARESWGRARVRLFRELDDFEERSPTDFPFLTSGVPILTARSLLVLCDLVEPFAEVLPLESDDGKFFALNVTTLPTALDYDHSEVTYYLSSGRLMSVERYAFLRERIADHAIFKLPETARTEVYVTDPFVERVQQHGLTGFKFNLLWEG